MEKKKKESETVYKIGTRGSALALWQANHVASLMEIKTELEIISTSGDRFLNIALQGQSETGFFTKEIENQLISGKIDIAVHSLKDLPTEINKDLVLAAYLPRASVNDILLIHPDWHDPEALFPLKKGCRVGATSLRRQSLLKLYCPGSEPAMLRGNVPTRIKKCMNGEYGAIILAQAGVERLGIDTTPLIVYKLTPEIWLPAPGQGVVAVQVRKDDKALINELKKHNDVKTRSAILIERELLRNFEGGCHTAFGAYAHYNKENWIVHFGLDQGKPGWGAVMYKNKDKSILSSFKASDIKEFSALPVDKRKTLCKKIQL